MTGHVWWLEILAWLGLALGCTVGMTIVLFIGALIMDIGATDRW